MKNPPKEGSVKRRKQCVGQKDWLEKKLNVRVFFRLQSRVTLPPGKPASSHAPVPLHKRSSAYPCLWGVSFYFAWAHRRRLWRRTGDNVISFKGYVYESTSPDMPIIAVIFDSEDKPVQMQVVTTTDQGMQFLSDFISSGSECRKTLERSQHWMAH